MSCRQFMSHTATEMKASLLFLKSPLFSVNFIPEKKCMVDKKKIGSFGLFETQL